MEFYSGQPENPAASVRDYCTGVLNCKTNDFRAGFKVAEWRMFFIRHGHKLALPTSNKFNLTKPIRYLQI
jgi:hypothetical protein